MIAQNNSTTVLRAVGYSRTSGEKQRDNTSIPRQQAEIEKFVSSNNWSFVRHYVDESKSGAKIEGRDDFKRMSKDAANSQFDIVVIYDISRFGRNGNDIIRESYFLKDTFNIHVIDTKGFDTRKPKNALLNFVFAGVAEDERLRIMERTIKARIHNAENGLPWSPTPPFGRVFINTGKKSGYWAITEEGKRFPELLKRYVSGEKVKKLAKEYNLKSVQTITRIIRESQLSADNFKAVFNSPDIGIVNHVVTIPNFPRIITPELEKKVRERMDYNRKWNKQHTKRNYLLSGFVYCAHCGKALKGQTQHKKDKDLVFYRHNNYLSDDARDCKYKSIKADVLENMVLDYLYNFFFDEPAYMKAIQAALPSDDDRKALLRDIQGTEKRLAQLNKAISNLINAIAAGADVSLLLNKQNEFKTEKQALENRLDELKQTLTGLPDPELIEQQAILLRSRLGVEFALRDWKKVPYEDVRKFLHFLFSDNPIKNGYGIFVAFEKDKFIISFNGRFDFPRELIANEANARKLHADISRINAESKKIYENGAAKAQSEREKAHKEYEKQLAGADKEVSLYSQKITPNKDYL